MMSRSAAAQAWAIHARGLTPTAWKVLVVLSFKVSNTRHDWDVWNRQQKLADDCEVSLATLKRHLGELEEKGFISRSKRMRKSGGYSCCTYTLAVKGLFTMPNGTTTFDFAAEDEQEEDDALAQSELPRSLNRELPRSLTAELAIEPSNPEPSNPEESPHPLRDGTPTESDLFVQPSTALVPVVPQLREETLAEFGYRRWHEIAEAHGLPKLRRTALDSDDVRKMEARARKHMRPGERAIDVWREAMDRVDRSSFLTGHAPPGNRSDPFRASFPFLLQAKSFNNLMSGVYDDRRDAYSHRSDGTRRSASERSLAEAIDSIRSDPRFADE